MLHWHRAIWYGAIAAGLIHSLCSPVVAQSGAQRTKAPKPDLRAGGPSPSEIANDVETEVTLPGFHLTGAHVVTEPLCQLVSYQVVSDNEIRMKLKGTRSVDDKESQCGISVRTSGGSDSTWVVVDLTPDQEQERATHQRQQDQSKAAAFVDRSGKSWLLKFAGGATLTYTASSESADGMPEFQSSTGARAQIAVSNDSKVMIVEGGCMRSGTLTGAEVKNGTSMGDCTPSGNWTATVTR